MGGFLFLLLSLTTAWADEEETSHKDNAATSSSSRAQASPSPTPTPRPDPEAKKDEDILRSLEDKTLSETERAAYEEDLKRRLEKDSVAGKFAEVAGISEVESLRLFRMLETADEETAARTR